MDKNNTENIQDFQDEQPMGSSSVSPGLDSPAPQNHTKKRKKRHPFLLIIFLIALGGFGFSAFKIGSYLYSTYLSNKVRSEIAGKVKNVDDEQLSDRELMWRKYGDIYNDNNDFMGWLIVEGTPIDNPVMYTPDDGMDGQFYLRKNFYGEYDIVGTLFIDDRCKLDPEKGVSTNTIIYGHRTINDTMFGPLQRFKDPAFCAENTNILFDTMYRPGQYKLFAAILSEATDGDPDAFKYYDFIQAEDEKALEDYLYEIEKRAVYYDDENAPKFGDEILTLSTCDKYKTDGRLALIARRIN